jgi:drug/metabolite transporter (DMT)-like permease
MTPDGRPGRRAVLLFASLGVIWGIPYLLIKVAVEELHPTTLVLARVAVAAAIMVPLAASRGAIRPALRRWRVVVVYAFVEIVVAWLFLTRAEQHLPSSLTGLLIAGVPIVGVLISLATRRSEHLGVRGGLGLGVGLVGVALLVGFESGATGGGGEAQAVAELAIVVVCYAIGPVIMARHLHDVPSSGVVALTMVTATAVYAVPGVLNAPAQWPSAPVTLSVVGLGVVCTALAFQLFFALVAEVGAVRTTLITYLNPAVAVVAGALVLDEPITWLTLAGFALVLTGSALASGRRAVAAAEAPSPECVPVLGEDESGPPNEVGSPDDVRAPDDVGSPDDVAAPDDVSSPVR